MYSMKRLVRLFLFLFVTVLFCSVSISSGLSNSGMSEIRLKVEVYNSRTGEPIVGLPVTVGIHIGNSEDSVTTDLNGEGQINIDPPADITLLEPIYVRNVSMPGIWFLDKIVGQSERSLARTLQGYGYRRAALSGNLTRYEFYLSNYVDFLQQSNGSSLSLKLKLYLTGAKIVQIYNPLSDIRKYDPRLSISMVSANFIEIGGSKAILPISEPLSLRLSITFQVESYGSIMFSTPRGEFSISVGTENRTFIDLTPAVIRGLSSTETNILKGILDTIEPYGFKLDKLYGKLLTVSALYEQSAQDFENQNRENGTKNLISAIYTFRDVYNETSDTYAEAVGWTPTLIIILVFFSLALSRMITEKRLPANIIFATLLALMFCLFFFTQPNFRLYLDFISSLLTQRIRIPFFSVILIQSLQALAAAVIILVICFTKLRDFAVQTFGVSMRNLRRRKMKTVLALVTIVLVSVATMSLLTFTPETTHRVPLLHRTSKVDNALVIYKRVIREVPGLSYSEWNEPLQPYEVQDFQSGDWVKSMNIYGIVGVNLRRDDGFTVDGFTRFNMVVVNPQFMEEYIKVSEIMGSDWSLNSTDRGMIIVGSEIASKYNLTTGSQVFLNNRRFTVKSVFNERNAIENLRDIDDEYFFSLPSSTTQIFDPSTNEIKGGSFIIGSTNDFAINAMSIYKVGIIAKDEYAGKIWNIAEEFLPSMLDYWTEDAGLARAQLVRTYEIHITSQGSVYMVSSGLPTPTVAGDWQIHIIPIVITSLLLLTNALATVAERKSEIRTLFTTGASPTRIRLIFILEGMTLGIIGGILGYVAGYGIAQVMGFALPSLVQQNLITGAPFTISFFTALASSLLGCLLPSRVSIKTVVPSGTLTKKVDEIMEIRETRNEAYLEVPIRLQPVEIKPFNDFLENLMKAYSYGMFRQLVMRNLAFTQPLHVEEKRWNFLVNCASDFQVSIISRPNEDLKTLITPYSAQKENARWGGRDYQNLRIMAPILRKELMGYLSYKPRQVTRREIR